MVYTKRSRIISHVRKERLPMNLKDNHYENELLIDLKNEIAEFNRHLRSAEKGNRAARQRLLLASEFDPMGGTDPEQYKHNLRLNSIIQSVLDECSISVKRRGYSYIKYAIRLITDMRTYDVRMDKDIYPLIAEKFGVKGTDSIEHDIRNAIDAAYKLHMSREERSASPMDRFSSKPTPKPFLLYITQEVNSRMSGDASFI